MGRPAEELIPRPLDPIYVFLYDFLQLTKSAGLVATIVRHPNLGFQPEFCFHLVSLTMYVPARAEPPPWNRRKT